MRQCLMQCMAALLAILVLNPMPAIAAENSQGVVHHFGTDYLMIAILLIAAVVGNSIERFRQPGVMGELLAGIAIAGAGYYGWQFVTEMRVSQSLELWASTGALLLLLSVGLESNVREMVAVGRDAFMVALVGMAVPFTLGKWVLGPVFFEHASEHAILYLSASMVATSVGITARVLRAKGLNQSRIGKTVIGAGVIDDVGGLIILAVVSSMVVTAVVSVDMVAEISLKSFGFLIGSIVVGGLLAGPFSAMFSRFSNKGEMKLVVAVALALIFGWAAQEFELEPIIGAFSIGLMLDPVKFKKYSDPHLIIDLVRFNFRNEEDREGVKEVIRRHQEMHLETLVAAASALFVPVFFVRTGMMVDFGSLLQPDLYWSAAAVSVAAITGKMVAGLVAQGTLNERLLIGASMVPRGEVGLIFAATGRSVGALNDEMFSIIVLMVIVTTFISPALIGLFANRIQQAES